MIESNAKQQTAFQQKQTIYFLTNKSPHIIYTPQALIDNEGWYHSLLGYPMCPLIGRYNKGEYRIGQVFMHLEFVCTYDEETKNYHCGGRKISIPDFLVYNFRNIPEVIPYNKPKGLKNQPDVHFIHHVPQKSIKLNFIVSFGEIGKDFLNYLNHCYIFDQSVFFGDKLNRTTCNIPIIVYLPEGSNICEEEVQRGISMTEWRSEYMSIHLKGGAPAFSPNNMRLGIKGMRKVVNTNKNEGNQHNKNKKEGKKKQYIPKQQKIQKQDIKQKINEHSKKQQQLSLQQYWQKLQKQVEAQQKPPNNHTLTQQNPDKNKKITYVHFYTAVLLQNDHRVNYHWHIQDPHIQDMLKQIVTGSTSVEEFANTYRNVVGKDPLITQLSNLLMI